MRKEDFDYNNLDKLDIYAKKEKANEVIECYETFGWELQENIPNAKYEDTCELSFTRPHKIASKDYLQYNQIEMENILNNKGKLERNKNAKTTTSYLCWGLLSAILIALGVLALCRSLSITNIIFSIVFFVLGILTTLVAIFRTITVFKCEKLDYEKKYTELNDQLELLKESVLKKRREDNAKED